MQYYKNYSLKDNNSFRLESLAKEIWFPENINDLKKLLLKIKNERLFLLGGGTNVLLKPIINRVICLTSMPRKLHFLSHNLVLIDANYFTSMLINNFIKNNIQGFEGLYGIPGTIGGAIVMNAGSGKYTISDYLSHVIVLDYTGKTKVYTKTDLCFARRYSILQQKQVILIQAYFNIQKDQINEQDLEKAKEHRTSMPNFPSAGGIFSNWHSLKPYKQKLIGLKVGDAQVSDSVNIIVNTGNASFNDISTLIDKIKTIVEEPLELEIKILGD